MFVYMCIAMAYEAFILGWAVDNNIVRKTMTTRWV